MTDAFEPVIQIQNLSYWYRDQQVLQDVTLDIPAHAITVIFGPAGSGKTSLLRTINRLNDLAGERRMEGRVLLNGQDIYAPNVDTVELRRRVGMVFALPLPLPGTVRENVTYGPRLAGIRKRAELDAIVEGACGRRRCGMRSKTAWTIPPSPCRAGNSSGCASPGA